VTVKTMLPAEPCVRAECCPMHKGKEEIFRMNLPV